MNGSVVMAVALLLAIPQDTRPPEKYLHAVEWTDPAGDVEPISASSGTRPGFDIVKLRLDSDGTALTMTATLKGPMSGNWGSSVLTLYLDADRNLATGYTTFWTKIPGFELKAELQACVDYVDGGEACVGSLTGAKVKGYHAEATLGRVTDKSGNTTPIIKPFSEPEQPIKGAVVSASLTYKDLGVKPGQTIRLLASETCGRPGESAEFPVALLTLK